MEDYKISVIMPTYNSQRTIEESLRSIRDQIFDQSKVEILVVDGGSTDRTLEIAEKYSCKILHNEKKLPEFAKQIGFEEAKGEWGIFIDSDEMFLSNTSFQRRIKFLERFPKVKNLVSTGMSCEKGETGVNRYANGVGDPFSFFVYRYNAYNRMESMKQSFAHKDYNSGTVYSFKHALYYPLYDALGNMFHIETARKLYKESGENESFIANIFHNMVSIINYVAMLNDDFVLHKPGMTTDIYKSKLVWRIKNNLFQTKGVGFASREKGSEYLRKRKILFVPYSLFIIPVLMDSFHLAIEKKDKYFLNHFWWNEYVFCTIVRYVIAKLLHIPVSTEKEYGKMKG